ncbi:MAG: DUF4236 domain-containing protein [Xanthomonadales bacterium]|nr:DUF4236 domain-containing protein [Planctomycetales bacterium]MCB1635467.1 DUF4236 domain-containing protein [Xanthomonadales bacterium]
MALYLRKSVSVGPFRFNISKSGLGLSAGIKGLRVGTGPRGNYIHMGRGGLYYRAALPPMKSGSSAPRSFAQDAIGAQIPDGTHEPMEEIESADIGRMVDSSSLEIVDELNAKRKRVRLWPLGAILFSILSLCVWLAGFPNWVAYAASVVGLVGTACLFYFDAIRKSTVIVYDIDDDFSGIVERLHFACGAISGSAAIWHLEAEGRVTDRKYHAGATSVVRRTKIALTFSSPPYVKTNVATPSIPVGKQVLYFFPDKVLIFEPGGVGAVSYENLDVLISRTKFIEDGPLPKDAEVVGRTWKYVNKRGGADKRFKDNREIPVVLYDEINFSSATGLNERIQLSKSEVSTPFAEVITEIGRLGVK